MWFHLGIMGAGKDCLAVCPENRKAMSIVRVLPSLQQAVFQGNQDQLMLLFCIYLTWSFSKKRSQGSMESLQLTLRPRSLGNAHSSSVSGCNSYGSWNLCTQRQESSAPSIPYLDNAIKHGIKISV